MDTKVVALINREKSKSKTVRKKNERDDFSLMLLGTKKKK